MPCCICYTELRWKTNNNWFELNKLNCSNMFNNILWRYKFEKEFDFAWMNERDFQAAIQFLTGHTVLNYYLSIIICSVQPYYPLNEAEEKIVSNLYEQCRMLGNLRTEYFYTYSTTALEITDRYKLRKTSSYLLRTKPLALAQ